MTIDELIASTLIFPGFGKGHRRGTDSTIVNRLPILRFLPRGFRAHFVAMCGEFTGTFLFLFFAFSGTQVANNQIQAPVNVNQGSNPAQLLYISLAFGFSLAANAWVFFRVSGGLFNPAVTFGLCLVGALDYVRGALIAVTQVMGGITAAAVVSALFPGTLSVRTTLSAGTSVSRGLFIEMFLTAQLVFTIFMLAAEKHKATFIAPVGIGLSLFIAELSGMYIPSSGEACKAVAKYIPKYTANHWRRRLFIATKADCSRCILHRRLPQPCSIICTRRGPTQVRSLSLGMWIWSANPLNIRNHAYAKRYRSTGSAQFLGLS